jgi:hypothetical protein
MIHPLLVVALAQFAAAAPAPFVSTGAVHVVSSVVPDAAPRTGDPYWFRTYSTAPYKEVWTAALALKDYTRDLPKVQAAVEASGGKLTEPMKDFVSSRQGQVQQMSFDVPIKKAKALLKNLRALGDMADPAVRVMGAPIPLEEVRAKIAVMMKEKTERAAELAKVPAAAAAEEEILEHLLMVEEVGARVVPEARVNLTVTQK